MTASVSSQSGRAAKTMDEAATSVQGFERLCAQGVAARFAERVREGPSELAVVTERFRWTYAELDGVSSRLAGVIREKLKDAGTPVALACGHDAPLIGGMIGALKAGRPYVALDPRQPKGWIEGDLRASGAGLILADESHAGLARELGIAPVVEIDGKSEGETGCEWEGAGGMDEPACIVYTSGTTGARRGVVHCNRSLMHMCMHFGLAAGLAAGDRLPLLASAAVAASASSVLGALLHGGTLLPFDVRGRGVDALLELCRRERVTVMHAAPTLYRQFASAAGAKESLSSVRLVRLGGDATRGADIALFRRVFSAQGRLYLTFSSSETGLIAQRMIGSGDQVEDGPIAMGRPVPTVEVVVTDEGGEEVATGEVGRLRIRSRYLTLGYWRNPEATREAYVTDESDPGLRTFVSGDMARLRPDGMLEHAGRADAVVKVRGYRVDTGAVEAALQTAPNVRDAAVTAVAAPSGESRLVAYVVQRKKEGFDSVPIRRALARTLPEHMVPEAYVLMESLPLTPSGKVDRRALPPPPTERSAASRPPFRAPRDPYECELAKLWQEILRVEGVGLDDSFFDLGATSLQTATLVTRIGYIFGQSIGAMEVAQSGTLEAMAAALASRTAAPTKGCLVTLWPSGTKTPFFCVHPAGGQIDGLVHLARRLDPDRPFHALRARGAVGEAMPLWSVPAMARLYLREVERVAPTGTVLLGGMCMGGLVAWEMAQQLTAAGRKVGLVALIDTHHPRPNPRTGVRHRLTDGFRDALRRLRRRAARLVPGWSARHGPEFRAFVQDSTLRASRFYVPTTLNVPIAIMRGDDPRHESAEDRRMWMKRLAGGAWTVLGFSGGELSRKLAMLLDEADGKRG